MFGAHFTSGASSASADSPETIAKAHTRPPSTVHAWPVAARFCMQHHIMSEIKDCCGAPQSRIPCLNQGHFAPWQRVPCLRSPVHHTITWTSSSVGWRVTPPHGNVVHSELRRTCSSGHDTAMHFVYMFSPDKMAKCKMMYPLTFSIKVLLARVTLPCAVSS